MVLWAIQNAHGGEILVPKLPSYKITDLARAVGPDCECQNIGIRPGEKIHEEMITASDSYHTVDLGDYFAILPAARSQSVRCYEKYNDCQWVLPGFSYSSDTNPDFLTVEQLRQLIREEVDPEFQV
jgi:FlaA1/EpsC-like NDP-sugar epimerase